jgi:hypothetical protein
MDRVKPIYSMELNVKRQKAAIYRKRSMLAKTISNLWRFENNN